MANVLHQFQAYLQDAHAKMNSKSFQHGLEKLMPENQFKDLVAKQLNLATDNNSVVDPTKLGRLLESIVPCLAAADPEIVNKLKAIQQKEIKSDADQSRKLAELKAFLKEILQNKQNKKLIEDTLWEEYLAFQNKYDPLSSKPINESVTSYFQQMQAEPLKRAGFILFTVFFEFLDQALYVATNGQLRLSNVSDNSERDDAPEESSLQKLWRQQKGVPFPQP